jgi:hypothetical protein
MPTLDIDERQVLVDYPDDANGFVWHHRVLLYSLGEGKWICAIPTLAIQRIDLAGHRLVILPRAGAFPADRLDQTFAFDVADVTADVLSRLRAEASGMAEVLGAPVAAAAAGGGAVGGEVWRVSDTSSQLFSDEIPPATVANEAIFTRRGGAGLVQLDGLWVHAALEDPQKPGLGEFRKRFHSGAGRDPRILGMFTDGQGRRTISLDAALPLLLSYLWAMWPIDGPRTVRDFLERVRTAGYLGFLPYHSD